MRQLWAPWRISYIRNKDEKGCVFCSKQKSNNDKNSLILSRGNHSFVLMNLYPYNNAHLLITPYNHVDTTDHLDIDNLNDVTKCDMKKIQKNQPNFQIFWKFFKLKFFKKTSFNILLFYYQFMCIFR